jgi:polar amino acid transport system substrate-binding protein
MKRLLTSLALIAVLSFALVVNAQDQDEMTADLPDLEGRTVTVAVENGYPPFNLIDSETGEPVGWDYDTIDALAELLNFEPEYIQTSWEGMIVAVSEGEFDVAADGITITEERAEIVDFSMGYAAIVQRLMVQLEEDRFDTLDGFVENEDYTIGVQLGTTNFLSAQELVDDDRIVGYPDFGSAVQALIAGDVDGVVIDDVAGQGYVGENSDRIRLIEQPISSDQMLGFIYPPGSELVEAFDTGLMALIENGTLDEINEKWGLGPFELAAEMSDEDMAEPEATEEADG